MSSSLASSSSAESAASSNSAISSFETKSNSPPSEESETSGATNNNKEKPGASMPDTTTTNLDFGMSTAPLISRRSSNLGGQRQQQRSDISFGSGEFDSAAPSSSNQRSSNDSDTSSSSSSSSMVSLLLKKDQSRFTMGQSSKLPSPLFSNKPRNASLSKDAVPPSRDRQFGDNLFTMSSGGDLLHDTETSQMESAETSSPGAEFRIESNKRPIKFDVGKDDSRKSKKQQTKFGGGESSAISGGGIPAAGSGSDMSSKQPVKPSALPTFNYIEFEAKVTAKVEEEKQYMNLFLQEFEQQVDDLKKEAREKFHQTYRNRSNTWSNLLKEVKAQHTENENIRNKLMKVLQLNHNLLKSLNVPLGDPSP